jgi:hypothetical protein
VSASYFFYVVLGLLALAALARIVRYCRHQTRRIDAYIEDLEECAHRCKPEEVEDLLIEVIGYGHTGMSRYQQMRLISTMHFLMGRRKDARKESK